MIARSAQDGPVPLEYSIGWVDLAFCCPTDLAR